MRLQDLICRVLRLPRRCNGQSHVYQDAKRFLERLRLSYLNTLSGATSFTRHAVDAVRLSYRLRLVGPVTLPLRTPVLEDPVFARPRRAGDEEPLEDEDGADVHADAVRYARLEVDRNCGPVDSERGGVRLVVSIEPRDSLRSHLVIVMVSRYWKLIQLLQKIRVDRPRLVIYFSGQTGSPKWRVPDPDINMSSQTP